VSKHIEQNLAVTLLTIAVMAWFAVLSLTTVRKQKRMPAPPVIAAALAYSAYVAAALDAGAEFPGFLREHLFDGLAPAAAVGLLVNNFPAESPENALPWIRRPVMVLVAFLAGGALSFGLIAAAAVFSSGTDNFGPPVALCAATGGFVFSAAFLAGAQPVALARKSWWFKVRWWFGKRPKRAAVSESRNPAEAAVPAPADAAKSDTAPRVPGDDLRPSPDASRESRRARRAR
jgi:hypothetical protein